MICPFCCNEIADDSKTCRFCGQHIFSSTSGSEWEKTKSNTGSWSTDPNGESGKIGPEENQDQKKEKEKTSENTKKTEPVRKPKPTPDPKPTPTPDPRPGWTSDPESKQKHKKTNILPIIIAVVVIIGLAIIIIPKITGRNNPSADSYYIDYTKSSSATDATETYETEDTSEADDTTAYENAGDTDAATDDVENVLAAGSGDGSITVDPSTEENYSNVLDKSAYKTYDSGIGSFNFGYPANLYNSVTIDDQRVSGIYGDQLEKISFSGNAGGELIYTLYERTDDLSFEEVAQKIYDNEAQGITVVDDSYHLLKVNDDSAFCVETGYTDEAHLYEIYDYVRIQDQYIMQMYIVFPSMYDDEGGYMSDALYRLCGFTNASDRVPQDYDAYLESMQ